MKSLTQLSQELSIPREQLAAILKSVPGDLWWPQGRGITVTPEGEIALLALVNNIATVTPDPVLQTTGTPEQLPTLPNTEEIVRLDSHPINSRQVIALRSNMEKIRVAVKDSGKMPGRPYFLAKFQDGAWACSNFRPINPTVVTNRPEWSSFR